jgi:hypothetical protein
MSRHRRNCKSFLQEEPVYPGQAQTSLPSCRMPSTQISAVRAGQRYAKKLDTLVLFNWNAEMLDAVAMGRKVVHT